jgi:hypothetical protein
MHGTDSCLCAYVCVRERKGVSTSLRAYLCMYVNMCTGFLCCLCNIHRFVYVSVKRHAMRMCVYVCACMLLMLG